MRKIVLAILQTEYWYLAYMNNKKYIYPKLKYVVKNALLKRIDTSQKSTNGQYLDEMNSMQCDILMPS